MDAIFALAAAPRARVLERAATRIPGCLYICLWAPVIAAQLHYSSIPLRCVDAWIGGGAGGDCARVREVFEAYRRSFCAAVSGCVPGWAYKDGRPYMELPEPDLTASASLPVQEQFYHEAGTKTAVFMGCEHGEIEVGLSDAAGAATAAVVPEQVQQSLLEELMLLTPLVPSSSSSSMPSLSIGSPEYSSLLRSMATTAAAAAESSSSQERLPPPPPPLPLHPAVQLPGLLPPAYGPFMGAAEVEHAAIAEAMLAVISCSAPPPAAPADPSPPPLWLARHRAQRWSPRRRAAPPGAFRAYSAALSPRARRRPGAPGQRMAKTAIALMLSVHVAMRDRELAAAAAQPTPPAPAPPPPQHTSSQLHHMISERRRRERLNESFQTLRSLLPPGIKKDKATVLSNTTEYMHKLIADVSELEKKNRELEAQLGLRLETGTDDGDSSERVQVDVTTGASTSASTSAGQGQAQEVSIRVTVRAECDLPEVVIAMLATIKKMGSFAVVTVDARQRSSGHAQVSITLQITAGNDEPDETSLKEAVAKAVEDAVARPPSPP
ncbi:unnamed protein product [Urochloa decumbens]|uniref:BHLH domain-containing protein n=1 Tax=Urochloa decumbens TaxID=240449 RepID=A0ABC9E9C5_9POAL